MNKKALYLSLTLKLVAFVLMIFGVIANMSGTGDFMAGGKSLFYFTIQSNIVAAIVSLIGVIFDLQKLKGKTIKPSVWFDYLKFIATIGVTLTFIIFWGLLAARMPLFYLYSFSNLTLHTFGPLLVVIEYIFFTSTFKPNKKTLTVAWLFPLFYFIFAMILSLFNVDFGYDMKVPYFFLDYHKLGWFKIANGNIGVIYWVLIILVIIYLIAWGIDRINQLRNKAKKVN